jgi:3-hydroxyisobutyrate dehydrogenase-like beta-hydroxyacid dehydrogenase
MIPPAVGFIGFGEAGSTLAAGLRSAGIEKLAAFDIQTDAPEAGPLIRRRAAESQTVLVDSPAALAESSAVLFSTVTSSSALDAARQAAPFLRPDHLYADLNSVSPALKRNIADVIGATGAAFVESAVMGPVNPDGHRVPMLLGGAGARRFADTFTPFGMRLEVLTDSVGTAAAVKMCRSIVVKGLEALVVECVLGARQYGAEEYVLASLDETFPGTDWKALADYMTGRVVLHGERRAREMEEVAQTLRAIGIEPTMAEATARRQEWVARLDLRSRFGPAGPATYGEVLDAIDAGSRAVPLARP